MKEDTKWRLRDSEGKEHIIIDSEKVDMQEELNKMITKQMKEIERLKDQLQQKENIINELDQVIIEFEKQIEEERKNYREIIGNFVDKVKELKGSE